VFVENARFYVSRDTRDLLTSADLRVYAIRISCISSLREHYYQHSAWSFTHLRLKSYKLRPIIRHLPHYFDAFLSVRRFA